MEYILHPISEIETRLQRLIKCFENLSGVLLFDSIDMGYFSGTTQDGLMYIARDSSPLVMIRKNLDRAREESYLDVVPLKSLKSLKSDLNIASGAVIGLELDVLPYNNYKRVASALEDVKIVDISEMIKQIRSLKSDFEIKLIEKASRIVDAGLASVQDHLVEGIREIELAAIVEATMRSLGHQGTVRFRRFNQTLPMGHLMSGSNAAVSSFVASPTGGRGPSLFHPQGPGFKKIRKSEPVLVDFAGVYNGYIADETRIFSIGRLNSKLEDAHKAALEIENIIAKNLRPGRTGREIFLLSEAEGKSRGFQDHLGGIPTNKCGFVGHGVGLEIDEYPVLGPVDHIIASNMTVAVEPKMIYPNLGVVGVEDTFLITNDGPKQLTKLDKDIWVV